MATTQEAMIIEVKDAYDNLWELYTDLADAGHAEVHTDSIYVAEDIVAQLVNGTLKHNGAKAVMKAFAVRQHSAMPHPRWWRTDLGQLLFAVKPLLGYEEVDQQTAAGILIVTRQRVAQYVTAGKLHVSATKGIQCEGLYDLWVQRKREQEAGRETS